MGHCCIQTSRYRTGSVHNGCIQSWRCKGHGLPPHCQPPHSSASKFVQLSSPVVWVNCIQALGPYQFCESNPLYVEETASPCPGHLASGAWLFVWWGLSDSWQNGVLNIDFYKTRTYMHQTNQYMDTMHVDKAWLRGWPSWTRRRTVNMVNTIGMNQHTAGLTRSFNNPWYIGNNTLKEVLACTSSDLCIIWYIIWSYKGASRLYFKSSRSQSSSSSWATIHGAKRWTARIAAPQANIRSQIYWSIPNLYTWWSLRRQNKFI